ncbi:MAG: Tetratricopeptide TPR_2 repeat protein [Candidatus Gottesmanbacteria bacterium GW2011_GWA2_44_17]|uniref:Tetratricopeptide TPR_2 repeat protein n=3 Tax=Candidatus Gottesmaniibacteriota TaxID=1752720 RepID=A0A0G1LJC2_9BACT|nr:MAG: hypothetical protein UV63_C0039G0007 [Microgenomates group bacterium GW2011_GWC1_43_11]KKT35295.1 MAG: Tetratricopeptide TPR_2 repeat protein [Candidatus Gottesmanbacteria bacterium GW2011_GWB1_44_11c]KKT46313.1 MAG: Tetratricopeptide TPR_2 repeat protein [Candidatus Gottesmanbacteria bacterium GW2011_GWA2_44_17]KKT59914.1 MAG: Tetratricopeptide TPR_2 repeat protein [Candidatus Gottesmanbacteria bacterium GW2011_GWA1_44_24b]HCM82927.1 hypothetical protein [Patescibacteria group bacteriu
MTKPSSSSLKKELAALPIARIETMDQSYVLNLREYLFANGCQVFVNTGPTENVTYFFVVGDSNFVKKTLAFRHELGKKQLVICWDTEGHESIEQFLGLHSKIVFVDPVPITSDVLSEIFTFLFTTKGKELNMQSSWSKKGTKDGDGSEIPHTKVQAESLDTHTEESLKLPSTRAYEDVQKRRIANLITDMFGKKRDTKTVHSTDNGQNKENLKTETPRKQKLWLSYLVPIALITFFLCMSPFLLYSVSFLIRGWSLMSAAAGFTEGKGNVVEAQVKNERFWSGYTHLTMPFVHGTMRFGLGDKTIQAFERVDRLSDLIADAELELLAMNDAVLSMGSSLILDQKDKQSLSPVVAVDTIRKSIPSIRNKLDLAAAYLQSFRSLQSFPFSLPAVQVQIEKAIAKIEKLRQVSEVGERISQLYPFIGGFRDKQRVAVILQNSSELRPTGGFIGSLAHLTVSEGSLEEMRIEDVYALDGQLKGHVEPPGPIKELLAQEHWYLRDSNWNPDFSKTSQTVQFFYEKETGERVESVVGVTSSFIVRILKVVGPVDIPFYNDRITADNFYLKSFYYSQANFFPGSNQKKDFLGALMEAILSKLQKNVQSGVAIMEIIHDSLASRDIQLYTADPEGQRAIEQFGWGGKVPAGSACLVTENQPPCVFSYVYINESNVGVNKVNAFIERSQTRSVQISETGTISETISRKIQNVSRRESGTGDYMTYLRIFFPSGSILTSLTLDGKPIPMKDIKTKRSGLPYGELDTSIPNLNGVAVVFEVAPGRERIISVAISHGQTMLTENKEAILTLFEQKQAGVDQVPITTTITYPPAWTGLPLPSTQTGRVVAKQGYLEYNTVLSQDNEFLIRFMR